MLEPVHDVLEFRLLGSLDVRRDGRFVQLTSAKHRVLLAALLLHAEQVVSFDELAEIIWGDARPESPRRAIQLYVTRLRKVLGPSRSEDIISTCPEGYRINARPQQIDLGRFRLALKRADQAAEAGDLTGQATALAEALAEWRGKPLAGLPSDVLQREVVPQLREQWIRSLERRFDVELSLGRGAEVVDELYMLTARHPLREHLWAQLMTALENSSRRADALNAYHIARRHLADELGIDPGKSLQARYAEILIGRPQQAGRVSSQFHAVPRQLPPDLPVFVGRADSLARLDRWHADARQRGSMTITLISGMAGMGKTALAAHWAHQVAEDFSDGQLWANLRGSDPAGPVTADKVLIRFLRALGVPDARIPADVEERVGLFHSITDGRRILIVLDDACGAEQVRPLLPATPGCLTVITSRSRLSDLVASEGAHPLVLDLHTA